MNYQEFAVAWRAWNLESLKTRTLTDIERLTTETHRARDDLGKPFTQADQLTAARERAGKLTKSSGMKQPPSTSTSTSTSTRTG